ncbi:ORC ubiquitin ligase 1 [Bulinus truncatus]|nr:ORC ubiquitin ligase 1 [Bulinus truncatus]
MNKHSTITFTLPISCQVCLGKVKQPVLCPNLHVFCQLCLDIWLKRNHQCPACRVEINSENPIKHIIGGQLEDEIPEKQSTPELRRARFDLMFYEYEDQFEKMRKEIIILKTENNILSAQLNDAEVENKQYKKENTVNNGLPLKKSSFETDGANLLLLTKNLQEAQKLYADIRIETGNLKKENSKLKEENISLTQENQSLRLELAQRSPKKFGRFTVATLETKISEQDKEIRQLKMALERSDSYIEELEQQLRKIREDSETRVSGTVNEKKYSKAFNVWPPPSDSVTESVMISATAGHDNTKRNLFGKSNLEFGPTSATSREHDVHQTTKHLAAGDHTIKNILKPVKTSDVIVDFSSVKSERTPKKVHFSVSGVKEKSKEATSFELELPSPLGKPSQLINQLHSTSGEPINTKTQIASKSNEDYSAMSDAEFKKRIANLLKDNNYQTDLSSQPSGSDVSKNSLNLKTRVEKDYKSGDSGKQGDQANDSSHLSIPELGNLDFSLTPEMTDCIELMNRAEKNVNLPVSSEATLLPATKVATNVVQQIPAASTVSHMSLVDKSHKLYGAPPLNSSGSPWQHQFYSSLSGNPYAATSVHHPQVSVLSSVHSSNSSNFKMAEISAAGLGVASSDPALSSRNFLFSEPLKVTKEFFSAPHQSSNAAHNAFRFSEPTIYFTPGLSNPYTMKSDITNQQMPSSTASTISMSNNTMPSTSVSNIITRSANYQLISTIPSKSQPTSLSTPNLSVLGVYTADRPLNSLASSHSVKSLAERPHYKGSSTSYPRSSLDSILSPSLSSSQLNWPDDSRKQDMTYVDTPPSLSSNKFKSSEDSLATDFSV